MARKRYAPHAFTNQLQEDPSAALGPILPSLELKRLLQPFKVLFVQEKE